MTRKSKREIERAIEQYESDNDDPDDVDVTSSVVTVREDDDGDPVVEEHPDAPEGFEFGPELDTGSDAVEARALVPSDDEARADFTDPDT